MADMPAIDVSSELAELQTGADSEWPSWDFCLLYENVPYAPIKLAAPSPDAAATTMSQLTDRLNQVAQQMGYPPRFSWASGTCGPSS
jgi:hypothetical protein